MVMAPLAASAGRQVRCLHAPHFSENYGVVEMIQCAFKKHGRYSQMGMTFIEESTCICVPHKAVPANM